MGLLLFLLLLPQMFLAYFAFLMYVFCVVVWVACFFHFYNRIKIQFFIAYTL
jgi:hypothetical protein